MSLILSRWHGTGESAVSIEQDEQHSVTEVTG